MPTFEAAPSFWNDFARLSLDQKQAFLDSRDSFVQDILNGDRPRASLRVKRFRRIPGVWELSWAADGRALFRYGEERVPGQPHIVWLRIGSHEIFRRP